MLFDEQIFPSRIEDRLQRKDYFPLTDPWNNRYQAKSIDDERIEVYSFGVDGGSHTFGNDEDDISTWNGIGKAYKKKYITRIAMYFVSLSVLALASYALGRQFQVLGNL